MTKRKLKDRIAKLEKMLAEKAERLADTEKRCRKLEELQRKVWQKNRRLKARNEQMHYQVEAMAESQLLIRSELYAYINCTQLKSAKAGLLLGEFGDKMPGAGAPPAALVYEDEQEKNRGREKRFGLKQG